MSANPLIWESEKLLKINDTSFFVTFENKELHTIDSTIDCFLLGKSGSMLEHSTAIGEKNQINKVLDIGIFKGGSVVLYDQLYSPEKIAAIEFKKKRVEALDEYISMRGKSDAIKPYYGIDQSDRMAMESILSAEFPDRDIDLIVDDASHRYKETRDCFNICFPYLNGGGLFVIEDWAWAHWAGAPWQIGRWKFWKPRPFWGQKALSNLLIELFMLAASRPDLVKEIEVTHDQIFVRKGLGELPEGDFDIGDHYLLRGKRFGAWL